MASKFIQPPIPARHVVPPKMMKPHSAPLLPIRFGDSPFGFCSRFSAKAAEQSGDGAMTGTAALTDYMPVSQIKDRIFYQLEGINRGIFGVTSAKKTEIEKLIRLLESQNPTPQPTMHLEKVVGTWRLIYSTITILGSKRTKLGLRDFISLGEFFQFIDATEGTAVNVIEFSARGLNLLSGRLTIEASFKIASETRVDINYKKSSITPDQLMNVFSKNYDLLLGVFNPEGWLEITYVDDSLRIGRDDKGNVFVLERVDDDRNA